MGLSSLHTPTFLLGSLILIPAWLQALHTHYACLESTGGWDEWLAPPLTEEEEEETAPLRSPLLHPTMPGGKPSGFAARLSVNQHRSHSGTEQPSSLFSRNLSRLCLPYYPTCYSFYFYIWERPALGAGKTTGADPMWGGEAVRVRGVVAGSRHSGD